MRPGACNGNHDRSQQNPCGHARETQADHRQVFRAESGSIAMGILVVGSVAYDSIKTPSGSVERELGGSATHFSLAASHFTDVRVVGVVGDDFGPEQESVFKNRNIDTRGIEKADGKTFYWSGEYGDNLNEAKTNFTHLNVFEKFQPKIPKEYLKTEYLFLGN